MKIAVIGAGALGCLLAGLLKEADEDVLLIAHTSAQAALISSRGIRIRTDQGNRVVPVKITAHPVRNGGSDLVIVAVKAYDTFSAARTAAYLVAPETIVLTLQNGLGNVEALAKYIDLRKIAQGTTTQASTSFDIGDIYHAASGPTIIGCVRRELVPQLDEIKRIFNHASIPTETTSKIEIAVWRKLLVNVAINPVSALTGLRNGELLVHEEAVRFMKDAVIEASKVADALKIDLSGREPFQSVVEAAKVTGRNKSSMLQDTERGRKTEVDFMNGAIARLGREMRISTPVNEALTWAVGKTSMPGSRRVFLRPDALMSILAPRMLRATSDSSLRL